MVEEAEADEHAGEMQDHTQLIQALSGIANSTDGGVSQVSLLNFASSAY